MRPQNSGNPRIASRISGSLPALATAGSGGRWLFFCSSSTQLWLKTTKGMGPEMLEPMERRNRPLTARKKIHRKFKIPEVYDALRVEIHAFSMMSVLVRHRSTISDIVSFESMACSFSDCSKSAGSLN
jgi:hypothetical protein